MAENESSKFIHHLILGFGIVVSQILPELPEEFSFSSLLALQTKTYEPDDRLTRAGGEPEQWTGEFVARFPSLS
jgi:hypothetical protein